MTIQKLIPNEIKNNLTSINGWIEENNRLKKLFKFKNFNLAIQFIVDVGIECEKMNHHPNWSNVYGNVDVEIYTHKVAGITELDFKLAKIMDDIAAKLLK